MLFTFKFKYYLQDCSHYQKVSGVEKYPFSSTTGRESVYGPG